MLTGPTALVLAAAFSGAAYYVNEVEQPARLALNDASLLAQWKVSYPRGYKMQASLAAVSGLFGLVAAWQTQHVLWLVGALLILTNWPFTIFVIKPDQRSDQCCRQERGGAGVPCLDRQMGALARRSYRAWGIGDRCFSVGA